MTISLPQKKLQSIKQTFQDLYQNPETTVLELTKVLRHLTSTILAILPAKLHCHFLQQQQIQALKKNGSYESQVLLNKESQLELLWWVKNIEIWKELNSTSSSSSLTDRCFAYRLGESLGGNENWRDMDSVGEKDAHKRTGPSCIKTGPGDLYESTGDKVTVFSDGQYSGPDLLSENVEGRGGREGGRLAQEI